MGTSGKKENPSFIRELLKEKSEEEIQAAEESFSRYLQIAKGIFEREYLGIDPVVEVDDELEDW